MTPLDDHTVSDDELVALAFDRGRPWPTPLPTVDVEDGVALMASAFRGLRSLGLRGGLVDGEFAPGLLRLAAAADASPGLLLYAGDEAGEPAGPVTAGLCVVGCSDGWLLDDITPVGVHRLRISTDEAEVVDFLVSFLQDLSPGGTVCLASWSRDPVQTLVSASAGLRVVTDGADQAALAVGGLRSWVSDAVAAARFKGVQR